MNGFKIAIAVLILSLPLSGFGTAAVSNDQRDLLKARELVWRARFANGKWLNPSWHTDNEG